MNNLNKSISHIISDLIILGSIFSLISFFLPFYAINGKISYGINSVASVFLFGYLVSSFATAYILLKVEFKEEIIRARNFCLISSILGIISIIIYIIEYTATFESNVVITPLNFNTGVSLSINILGLMLILVSLIIINRSKYLFPIKNPRSIPYKSRSTKKAPLINTSLLNSNGYNQSNSSTSNINNTNSPELNMISCSNCGNNFFENQIFCSNCGNRRISI